MLLISLSLLIFALEALGLPSCYLIKQGIGLANTYSGAVPLSAVSAEYRQLADLVLALRAASADFGLKQSKNYSHFKKLDRDYVVDVVQAAGEFSVDPYMWSYPILGRMPYQGYFSRKDADTEASRLKKLGYEVLVRKVEAFSTLGWFRDPIFSFFSKYSEGELAELIFHESTHATLYLSGKSAFNEALATVVGRAAASAWLRKNRGEEAQRAYENSAHDNAAFAKAMLELREERRKLFNQDLDKETLRQQRREGTVAWLARYNENYSQNFLTENYRFAPDTVDISNAYLSLFAVYWDGTSVLEARLAELGGDIPRFLADLALMPKNVKDPYAWIEARD